MSSTSSHQPASELGRQLLASARDDGPPVSSRQRALALVDSTSAAEKPRSVRTRWAPWALAAAAVLIGGALSATMKRPSEGETAATAPLATASQDPDTPPAATAVAITRPQPAASTAASAGGSSAATPSALAQRDDDKQRVAAKPPATAGRPAKAPATVGPPAPPRPVNASCNCAADDLMCQMACAKK